MDTSTLTRTLQSLNTEALSWKFALYNTYRGSDGLELEWNLCEMQGIETHTSRVRDYLLKKPVAEKEAVPFTPFLLDKENIGALEQTDELIHDRLADILLSIRNGQSCPLEDFVTGVLPKTSGYAFYGERRDDANNIEEEILFMHRGTPFISTAPLFIESNGKAVSCEQTILKLAPAADFVLAGGVCYILSSSIVKDFSLEERHYAIARKQLGVIADATIINNYEYFEECVMKTKNARKFADFDTRILEHITRISIVDREEFLSTYGVTIDREGHMDTSDPEQCELIIDLLCCRSCIDPLGRFSVGSNITPRE